MKRTVFQVQNSPLPQNFIPQLPEVFENSGQLIHNARNQIRVFDINGQKVNVKKYIAFFRIIDNEVQAVRVLYGMSNYESIL